ncbi:MAG: BLUF domain-containing protein [Cohaesibacter sp.]|nr:BLUF domain-containing protein [Cohaesibacter sp.]
MLKRVIYFSSQTYFLKVQDLKKLLAQCKKNNKAKDLTGLLIYKDGSFCQTVEGEEEPLDMLIGKLSKDPRHKNMLILDYRSIQMRRFKRWSMAFENFDTPTTKAMNLRELGTYLEKKFTLPEEHDLLPHMLTAFSRPA